MKVNSGIYKIANTINDKIYVGSSLNFDIRWALHKNLNRTNCKRLKNAMLKHGVDKFYLEPIEFVDVSTLPRKDADVLLKEKEQFYLDCLQPFETNGYNIHRKANGTYGTPHTTEFKQRITGINSPQHKQVNKFSMTGEFIKTYDTISQAADDNKPASVQTIIRCCKGNSISTGGFMWTYINAPVPIPRTRDAGRRVVLHDNNTTTHFSSVKKAAKFMNCSSSVIVDICKGKIKKTKLGDWRYT